VSVFLNGNTTPEISADVEPGYASGVEQIFVGGRNDNGFNFEGKIDEVSVFNRALSADEISKRFKLAEMPPK
jgi:hypothetical protein